METKHIASADAGPRVRDVMLLDPTTVPSTATVADARRIFESPRQKLLLVADGTHYAGGLTPAAIEGADDDTPLGTVASRDTPTLDPEEPTERVYAVVEEHGLNRVPVVDADGELLGLVCFNRSRGSFCVA
jgi:CBS domain-containing protein